MYTPWLLITISHTQYIYLVYRRAGRFLSATHFSEDYFLSFSSLFLPIRTVHNPEYVIAIENYKK